MGCNQNGDQGAEDPKRGYGQRFEGFACVNAQPKGSKKAAKAGFDWEDISGALDKVSEETEELKQAIDNSSQEHCLEELGDLLFSVVNVSRFLDLDSEYALTVACDKFIDRFKSVEFLASQRGINMKEASLRQLDALWEEVKASRSQSSYSDEYNN